MTTQRCTATPEAGDPPPIAAAGFSSPGGRVALVTLGTSVLAGIAWLSGAYPVVPALGPSLLLAAFRPDSREASPTSLITGHGLAVLCGVLALALFGLLGRPPAFGAGLSLAHVLALSAAMGMTAAAMLALDRMHPPAASMTLFVALGIAGEVAHFAGLGIAILVTGAIAGALSRGAARSQPRLATAAPAGPRAARTLR